MTYSVGKSKLSDHFSWQFLTLSTFLNISKFSKNTENRHTPCQHREIILTGACMSMPDKFSIPTQQNLLYNYIMGRAKRIWYLSPMRAAKVQASLRIRAVSPEPSLLAHTSSESRGTFRQKAKSLAPLNGWACAVKIGHDGMLEDTNSLDGALIIRLI